MLWFGSRWLDPVLGRWIQPDSIVPGLKGSKVPLLPLAWDRYAFTNNNPTTYIDPDGHFPILAVIAIIGAFIYFSQVPSARAQSNPDHWGDPKVQAFGAVLMTAPALGPLLCEDGNCGNEIDATGKILESNGLDSNGNPVSTGKTLFDSASKANIRDALKTGLEQLSSGQSSEVYKLLGKGKMDTISLSMLENGTAQMSSVVSGGDGSSFVRYVWTLDKSGAILTFFQFAYDKAGALIHVHDKLNDIIIK